ncbi:baculoviral IAP repeat-containing protein 3-like isoform X2 [Littorina saxatilis]|uniref:baculoviral IAP repeat-containing protein 3-like isoform X2 n=1 Tax=Littorina saxatilis TaxID=31220 RepID=UPI0038B6AF6B
MSKIVNNTSLSWCVAPATSFLPDVTTRDTRRLDHVGYRLASLAALPASCNISRVRLAEAGFHYDPRVNSSAVVCHKCGAAFNVTSDEEQGFLSASSPLAFHRSVSPQCPFLSSVLEAFTEPPPSLTQTAAVVTGVQQPSDGSSTSATVASSTTFLSAQIGTPQEPAGRMSDLSEDCDARLPTDGAGPVTRHTALTSSLCQPATAPPDSADDRPQMSLGSAVYPQFSTVQSRLATFSNWTLSTVFPPQALAALGFYYAGYADCVRCFYCGVGLKSWDERDDVTTEHVRWRPQCGFLLATKGRQFIQNMVNRLGQGGDV